MCIKKFLSENLLIHYISVIISSINVVEILLSNELLKSAENSSFLMYILTIIFSILEILIFLTLFLIF